MSDKFHINPSTGNPNKCSAKSGNCPFGDDSEHFESKQAAREHFENQNSSSSLKSSRSFRKTFSEPVEPTAAHGYTEKLDADGNVTQRVRLVNNRPTDHPSGAAAVFKYSEKRVEEIHYNNGELHDGTGNIPSRLVRIIAGPNAGTVITERGYRGPHSVGFRNQDSPDGQPGYVIERPNGSKEVEYFTGGRRQDPASGDPAMVKTHADGSSISVHFTSSYQEDPADGSPAVVYRRADGSIEKTVRCYHSYVWDTVNGEPAVVNYDSDGNVESVKHAGLIYSESQNHYVNPIRESPIKESFARDSISWMKTAPTKRYVK
jgi:hypothetical protein